MNKTSIEWTDYTSNLIKYRDPEGRTVHGCIKVSPGCANCYASAWSARGLTGERDGAFTAKRQAASTRQQLDTLVWLFPADPDLQVPE